MKFFPAAVRTVFELPSFHLPAADGCGVIRRRRGVDDESVPVSVVDNPFPVTLRLRSGPNLRTRT